MNMEDPNVQSKCMRIKECEVCGKHEAKYTCPRCEVRTCCLECVKIHKKELECNGLRDKVKFKSLRTYNNIDLLNDYRLLEETARVVGTSVKLPAISCYSFRSGTLSTDLYRLKCTAMTRGVQLHFLPPSFNRHCTNTSYLDHGSQNLYWRVDWVFPQAENITLTDERVLDSSLLSACVHKYIASEERAYPSLSFYQAAGHSGMKLLLKAERTAPNRYYMLDSSTTLRQNLEGKAIVEYPVVYVVLSNHIHTFSVFTEEEEEKLRKKQRRRLNDRKKNREGSSNNFLFSRTNDEQDIESAEEMSGTEDIPFVPRNTNRPYNKHNSFPHRGRGRRQNHFRNKWNPKNGRGKPYNQNHFHSSNRSDQAVNGQL